MGFTEPVLAQLEAAKKKIIACRSLSKKTLVDLRSRLPTIKTLVEALKAGSGSVKKRKISTNKTKTTLI